MGMYNSRYILQAKLDKLLGDIKGVKSYINDVLVLSKDILSKNIDHLIFIFDRLRFKGLKWNVHECRFGLKEINHLGYVITWKYIKPGTKKLQWTMDIDQPTSTPEVRSLIGMVQ